MPWSGPWSCPGVNPGTNLSATPAGDGRANFAELGQRVGLSAPAVKRRMEKLEAAGLVTGYTVVVDEAKLGTARARAHPRP
jgi:predicted ArsR family transcriptional regulator